MLFHIKQELCGLANGSCRPELMRFFYYSEATIAIQLEKLTSFIVSSDCMTKVSLLASEYRHNTGLTMLGRQLLKITNNPVAETLILFLTEPTLFSTRVHFVQNKATKLDDNAPGCVFSVWGYVPLIWDGFSSKSNHSLVVYPTVMSCRGGIDLNTDVEVNRL